MVIIVLRSSRIKIPQRLLSPAAEQLEHLRLFMLRILTDRKTKKRRIILSKALKTHVQGRWIAAAHTVFHTAAYTLPC